MAEAETTGSDNNLAARQGLKAILDHAPESKFRNSISRDLFDPLIDKLPIQIINLLKAEPVSQLTDEKAAEEIHDILYNFYIFKYKLVVTKTDLKIAGSEAPDCRLSPLILANLSGREKYTPYPGAGWTLTMPTVG